MQVSRAFQTVLGMIVTNVTIVERIIASEGLPRTVSASLTDSDIAHLETLVRTQRERMLAVAHLMTARRRGKAMSLLPATVRVLGRKLEEYWAGYLESTASRTSQSPAEDATAFASWTLCRIDAAAPESQLVRYEQCQSDIANRMSARVRRRDEGRPVPLSERSRIQLSDYARVEQFDCGAYAAMQVFRETGRIACEDLQAPEHLIFHGLRQSPGMVTVTKVSKPLALVLEAARPGLEVGELLVAMPAARRERLQSALRKFVATEVLKVLV